MSTVHTVQMQAMEALGPGVKYSLVHGKLTGAEKVEAIQMFASGETPVLVSTSVVEVSKTTGVHLTLKRPYQRLYRGEKQIDATPIRAPERSNDC